MSESDLDAFYKKHYLTPEGYYKNDVSKYWPKFIPIKRTRLQKIMAAIQNFIIWIRR